MGAVVERLVQEHIDQLKVVLQPADGRRDHARVLQLLWHFRRARRGPDPLVDTGRLRGENERGGGPPEAHDDRMALNYKLALAV